MDQIPQELLDSLEVFFAIYSAVSVLAAAYALFNHVAMGVSLFRMMDKTGVSNPWMAWVPFCNVYALGDLADTYNLLCEGKATRYGKRTLTWFIVAVALSQPTLLVLYAMNPEASVPTDLWLLLAGLAAAATVYSVFYFISLYKIYRLFSDKAVALLVLSVATGVAVPFILLYLSRRDPRLPFGDSEDTEDTDLPVWEYTEI